MACESTAGLFGGGVPGRSPRAHLLARLVGVALGGRCGRVLPAGAAGRLGECGRVDRPNRLRRPTPGRCRRGERGPAGAHLAQRASQRPGRDVAARGRVVLLARSAISQGCDEIGSNRDAHRPGADARLVDIARGSCSRRGPPERHDGRLPDMAGRTQSAGAEANDDHGMTRLLPTAPRSAAILPRSLDAAWCFGTPVPPSRASVMSATNHSAVPTTGTGATDELSNSRAP